jgi:nitrite reductase (cytochrome c-552)
MAIAGHGAFFHAPEEVLRLLGSANEQAQQARIKLVGVLAKHGVMDFMAPEFNTKEKAQKIAKVDMPALIAEKLKFKETLEKEWKKEAIAKGRLAPNSVALDPAVDAKSSYFDKTKK